MRFKVTVEKIERIDVFVEAVNSDIALSTAELLVENGFGSLDCSSIDSFNLSIVDKECDYAVDIISSCETEMLCVVKDDTNTPMFKFLYDEFKY